METIFDSRIESLSKIEMLVKQSKFWIKICSKLKIVGKNPNFVQKSEFGQKAKFWTKIKILLKTRSCDQKFKFGQKSKCKTLLIKNILPRGSAGNLFGKVKGTFRFIKVFFHLLWKFSNLLFHAFDKLGVFWPS